MRDCNWLILARYENRASLTPLLPLKKKKMIKKNVLEIKRTNFGNQKISSEIKRTTQESLHLFILVILLEHRTYD